MDARFVFNFTPNQRKSTRMKRYMKPKDAPTPDNAEAILDKIGKRCGATPDGITWMKNALDPFPDVKRPIVGYPDTIKTPSIIQYFREELNVTTPSLGAVNWDCHIYHPGYYGNATSRTSVPYTNASGSIVGLQVAGGGAGPVRGSIMVRAGAAGAALSEANVTQSIPDSVSLELQNRIVAFGFEVFNTTPDLYKGGSVTTWRQPPLLEDRVITIVGAAGVLPSAAEAYMYADPPNTSALALNLEGSLEWDAEDGAYCVATHADPTNAPKTGLTEKGNIMQSGGITYTDTIITTGPYCQNFETNVSKSPYDQFGAYFTGLNTNTTLKVVKHYLIERFPTYLSVDLVTMAKPTPAYDPRALELYTQIASFLPTGVPVEDNFIGAFLSGLARVAKAVAPIVIPAIANSISSAFAKPKTSTEIVVQEDERPASFSKTLARVAVPIAEALVNNQSHNNNNNNLAIVPYNPNQGRAVPVQQQGSAIRSRSMQSNVFVSNNRSAASGKGKRQRGNRLLTRAFEN